MFKIVFDLSHLTFNDFSEFTKLEPKRAHHSYELYVKGGKSWRDPPLIVVEAGNLPAFKNKLAVHLGI